MYNAPLLRRESPNRRGVRSGLFCHASAATSQQWGDGCRGNYIVVASSLGVVSQEVSWCGKSPEGSGPQWGPLPFGPHVVRIGSDPVFDHDGWPDEGVSPKVMPAFNILQGV
jgi:hypothetical protein